MRTDCHDKSCLSPGSKLSFTQSSGVCPLLSSAVFRLGWAWTRILQMSTWPRSAAWIGRRGKEETMTTVSKNCRISNRTSNPNLELKPHPFLKHDFNPNPRYIVLIGLGIAFEQHVNL